MLRALELLSLFFLEDVADTANGMDQFFLGITVNLLSQVVDKNIDIPESESGAFPGKKHPMMAPHDDIWQ
jgi:hypothetical protein